MNYRKLRGGLTPTECKALEHAWIEAARLGRPLNRLLTVKPGGDLSPLDHAQLVDRTCNKLGGWSRYHGGGFYCLLVREKEPGGREHFHALIHVPPGKTDQFGRTFRGWFAEIDDIDIRPADQTVRWTSFGKLRSIIGYLTKQRSPQAAWGTAYSRRRGDRVLGKRARISMTLRSPMPISISVVKPVKQPVVSIPAPSIKSEAA
jgi:hypothetical protein